MTLTATCAGGLEDVLAAEIVSRGWTVTGRAEGAVRFTGPKTAIAEANIVLRTASRILVPVTNGRVESYDQLYRLASGADWRRRAPPNLTVSVTAVTSDAELSDTRFAALRVKDAIVDDQRRRTGRRSSVDRRAPDVGIVVYIANGRAEISLDATGKPLHMRGYRTESGPAPLRETVAAGIVLLSGWDRQTPLGDPFCGSGTIAIEAAMIAAGILPGIRRTDFAFLRWPGADRTEFNRLREEYRLGSMPASLGRPRSDAGGDAAHSDGTLAIPQISGSDVDSSVVELARRNARRAGVEDLVRFEVRDFFAASGPPGGSVIVTNPPYGERMDLADAENFYRLLGDKLKQDYSGSTAWILSANRRAMKQIGLRTSARLPLFNGGLESRLYRIELF